MGLASFGLSGSRIVRSGLRASGFGGISQDKGTPHGLLGREFRNEEPVYVHFEKLHVRLNFQTLTPKLAPKP